MGWFFPRGFYDADIIIIEKKKKKEKELNVLSFMEPFTEGVWWMMLLTVFFSSMITWFLQKLSGSHEPGKILMTEKWREIGEGGRGGGGFSTIDFMLMNG
jgi:hypothetical protein